MKKITALGISTFAFLGTTSQALAAGTAINPCAGNGDTTGTNFKLLCDLSLSGNIISNVVTILFVVATLIALGFLILGGLRWILSGGEKEKVEEARKTIVAALIGLVITFLAYFIINIVFSLFGLGNINSLNAIPTLNLFK